MNILLLFFFGFLIFGAVIYSFILAFSETKSSKKVIEDVDSVDYDGGGNWGRVPPKKD
tara:strand:- start:956 stop:1129 length:174 start_codon:yes stop_codon:yes gene_type:complete